MDKVIPMKLLYSNLFIVYYKWKWQNGVLSRI